jgi:hypothetical protein
MRSFTIYRRGVQVLAGCGLLVALCLAAGCGRKAAPAPVGGAASSRTNVPTASALPNTNVVAATATNLVSDTNETSAFEDLPPQKGKDPFFPTSHRRDPKVEAVPTDSNVPAEPTLMLKAIVYAGKHSQAWINNEVFEVGTRKSVDKGKVNVQCIEISSNFVRVQVEGKAEPDILSLEKKKK